MNLILFLLKKLPILLNMENKIYGLTGLTNQGNTCYMNSILQCLSNCKEFRNLILDNKIIHTLNNSDNIYDSRKKLDNTLSFQLRKIFSYMWFNDYEVIQLSSFRKLFCKKLNMFSNFNQHDSQEALSSIIDTIHEELAQKYEIIPNNKDIHFDSLKYYYEQNLEHKIFDVINDNISKYLNFKSFIDFEKTHENYSNIYDIFEGRTISQLKCPVTNRIKANFDSQFYFTLSLINNDYEQSYTTESSSDNSVEEINEYEIFKKYENKINLSNEIIDDNTNDDETDNDNSNDNESDDYDNFDENESNDYDNFDEDNKSNKSESNDYSDNESIEYESNENDIDENDNKSNKSESNDYSDDESIEYESNENDIDEDDNNNYLFEKVKKCNIYDLFDNFAKAEILDNDNQWFSPYCQKKVNAERINLIWDSPKVLIILLKRFEYTDYGAEKLNHLVDFPIYDLDITKYLHENNVSKYKKYNLFAINNHDSMNSNGIDFGHYYSYCKNSINNKWYNFDDDDVDEINEDDLVTNKAYMLFYEAIN